MNIEKLLLYYSDILKAQSRIVNNEYTIFVDSLIACKGKLVIFGMGKSGLVGKKISSTLTSVGMPTVFVNTAESLHGDLGLVQNEDIALIISNSGEAQEFDYILKYLQSKNILICCITKNKTSTLFKKSNIKLLLVEHDEICKLNTAPTTSTILTLALGDTIAVSYMDRINFTKDDYAKYHPSGMLGFSLKKVFEVYTPKNDVPTVNINSTYNEMIIEMIIKKRGTCVVVEDNQFCGIITDGDIRRNTDRKISDISSIYNTNPITINSKEYLQVALNLMSQKNVNSLVVMQDGIYLGILYLEFIKKL